MTKHLARLAIAQLPDSQQTFAMLSSGELLARLTGRKIKQKAIADVLGIDQPGVSRMLDGRRTISLDEGKKLVEAFDLEDEDEMVRRGLSSPVARRVARHAAASLGIDIADGDGRLDQLAEDLSAFAVFIAMPGARDSVERTDAFFQALEVVRSRRSR